MQKEKGLLSRISQETLNESSSKAKRDYWLYFFGILQLGSLLAFSFLSARDIWLRIKLPENGVPTTGTIIEHRYFKGRYYLTSEYTVVGPSGELQMFKQEYVCSEEQYQNYSEGVQIALTYSPQNPKISEISGDEGKLNKGGGLSDETLKRIVIFGFGPALIMTIIQSVRKRLSSSN